MYKKSSGTGASNITVPSILIVDDQPHNLRLLEKMLQDIGAAVYPAISGALALQFLQTEIPDLILLDIMMPGMDGFALCSRIKSDHRLKDIPVIFMSALSATDDKVRAFELGAVDYVTKPLEAGEVLARVKTHLTLSNLQKNLQDMNVSLEHEVEIRTKELESANAVKSQFLANMNHELRTPLNGITGFSNLLFDTSLSQEQKSYLDKITSSSRRLNRIIQNILHFSLINNNKAILNFKIFNIPKLINTILPEFQKLAENKKIDLCFSSDENPGSYYGDQEYLKWIIENLLDNAIKFTESGTITLDIRKSNKLVVTVADNGVGIPSDKIQIISEQFYQAEEPYTKNHQGIGLGLALIKQYVELLDGELKIESKVGTGSVFTVILPVDEEKEREVLPPPTLMESIENTVSSKPRILIAEDEAINRMYLSKLLRGNAFEVDEAANGEIVVEMSKKTKYDLILMDIGMPKMNGINAANKIRQEGSDWGKRVPIIAVTAHASPDIKKLCMEAGMNDFILKPVDKDLLFDSISRHVGYIETK